MRDQITNKLLAVMFTSAVLVTNTETVSGVRLSSSKQEVAPVRAVAPVYPIVAIAAGVGGSVIIEAQIDRSGVVTSVRAVAGPKLLHGAAEKSAKQWLFTPVDDSTGIRVARLTFVFTLMPGDPLSEELVPILSFPTVSRLKEQSQT